jgi:hypothetical protein
MRVCQASISAKMRNGEKPHEISAGNKVDTASQSKMAISDWFASVVR